MKLTKEEREQIDQKLLHLISEDVARAEALSLRGNMHPRMVDRGLQRLKRQGKISYTTQWGWQLSGGRNG